jgi:Kelch motif
MNTPRSSFAAVFAEKTALYVIGGKRSGIATAECERYDLTTNKWYSIASLNLAAYACSACSFNKRDIYKYGGIGPQQ